MKTLVLIAGDLAIGIGVYFLWKKYMAKKDEVLQLIQANHNVVLARIADVKTGVETLIAQGGGGGTGEADLDAVAADLSAKQTDLEAKFKEIKDLLPGGI